MQASLVSSMKEQPNGMLKFKSISNPGETFPFKSKSDQMHVAKIGFKSNPDLNLHGTGLVGLDKETNYLFDIFPEDVHRIFQLMA